MHAGFGKRLPGKRADRKIRTAPRAEFHRPSPALITEFIDQQCECGYAVEQTCQTLTTQGTKVSARTYRGWKQRQPASRAITDAQILNVLHDLQQPDPTTGRPRPEVLYGRRNMRAWLQRNGFPDVSKHTVDLADA